MNTNLLSNKELEDYQNEDSFDFLIKAEAIRAFLEFNSTSLEKNKMLVLYGDWGSGKTSLMKHIEAKIDKGIYYPIFFHAWAHEKDENLPLSLCDRLLEAASPNAELIKKFVKGAIITLKSFASGITLKSSGFLSGLGIDIEISGGDVVEALDKALEKTENPSFYKSNKAFKESFQEIEDLILKKHQAQKILIFIDDLDRCGPENVLNLITALKLFFTYGNKSVYFCGIDKDAVTKAVKTKYKDVVKSEEYMEKVFDISFNMPKTFFLKKFLQPHFHNFTLTEDGSSIESLEIIEDFFKSIDFTTPRHLKKVLNKYEILKSFKNSQNITRDISTLIPDLIGNNNSGKIFETIYALFIIILYDFYPDHFKEVEDYKQKMVKYTEVLYSIGLQARQNYTKGEAVENCKNYTFQNNVETATISQIITIPRFGGNSIGFGNLLYIFSNSRPSTFTYMLDKELYKYNQFFIDDEISTEFCKFLITHHKLVMKESEQSDYVLRNIFKMVKYLL